MKSLNEDIINNARRLNSLLAQELWRLEQSLDTRVSQDIIRLADVSLNYSRLINQIPNINAVIRNSTVKYEVRKEKI